MPNLTVELLQQEIDEVITENDISGAFECFNLVKGWLEKTGLAKKDPAAYSQYYNCLMKLKFLSLNYFDDVSDYYDLLKNHFSLSQDIRDFDLWSKLEIHLVGTRDLAARDVFKGKLKEALERSDSLLVSRQQYPDDTMPHKVNEWIKDFVANLGLEDFDKLKKTEYITNSQHVRALSESDKEKVRHLLDIYEKLKLSSQQPQGYENAVAMEMDGQHIIFNRGEIENIDISALKGLQGESGEETTPPVAGLTAIASPTPTSSVKKDSILLQPAVKDLESALNDYATGSLEYKAIKQEISRLKAAELQQAKRAAAKQDVLE